jgi:hypothetical protein
MKQVFLFAVVTTLALAACKKDKGNTDNDAKAITKANILGSYKITAIKLTITALGQSTDQDGLQKIKDCEKDDVVTFLPTDTATIEDKGILCGSTTTIDKVSWSLVGDSLSVDSSSVGRITLLTAKQMLTRYEETVQGVNTIALTTFTRQ